MNYKVRIQKNKDFQILENNMPIVKGSKPKWYSSEILFFLNNRTFQIKKKSFWKSVHEITASGKKVGDIFIRGFKKPLGNFIQIYENNSFKDEFSMTSTSKSIWSSEKTYSLFNKDNEILKINYSWKKHIISNLDNFKKYNLGYHTVILIFLFLVSCSNILFNHDDAMSMLTTKQLVIDRFGEPTEITETNDYDEYYYDFGVFEERVNYFDPQISLVTAQPKVSKIENEFEPQFRINVSSKYIKFHLIGEKVIYWESQNVKFPVKKK